MTTELDISSLGLDVYEVRAVPEDAGVYCFYNADKKIIYVGKAKNLKKRVQSYFQRIEALDAKTRKMVKEITLITFTSVDTEHDALLLENNLIKNHQPTYNVLLKDGKSFPYICIKEEAFPRIVITRRLEAHTGKYFGPYTDVPLMKSILHLIRQVYKIRTCTFDMSEKNIQKKKYKVCLEYHIGNCAGPCEGLQSREDYERDVQGAMDILRGKLSFVKQSFQTRMYEAREKLQFEAAQYFKEKIQALQRFQSRSIVASLHVNCIDVCTFLKGQKNNIFVHYMRVEQGMIILGEAIEASYRLQETDAEAMNFLLVHLREKHHSKSTEVLSNIALESWDPQLHIHGPQRGDKQKLVALSLKNAQLFRQQREQLQHLSQKKKTLIMLQRALRLSTLPVHMECFDVSNLHGKHIVGSMVCFKQGKPSKTDYRRFVIRQTQGKANDYASMQEIVGRRYQRLLKEGGDLPQLIIIDGGKGQLEAACQAMHEVGIYGKVAIVGLAKRLEEIFLPKDSMPLRLSKRANTLHLLEAIRDEAHRFAITMHRKRRNKAGFSSALDEIKGIGTRTKQVIWQKYSSLDAIREAAPVELSALIGKKRAELLQKHLQKNIETLSEGPTKASTTTQQDTSTQQHPNMPTNSVTQ